MKTSTKVWLRLGIILVLIGIGIGVGGHFMFRSTWEKNVSTATEQLFSVDVGDGTILIARNFHQYFKGTGFNTFPDGGGSKERVQKQDVFRIGKDNSVLWETSYITESTYSKTEAGYSYAKYANLDVPYHEVRVTIPDLNVYGYSTVRKCSSNVFQFAPRLVSGVAGTTTDSPEAKLPGATLKEPGLQINIDDGSASTFTAVSDLCETILYDGVRTSACSPFEIAIDSRGVKKIQYTASCPIGYLYGDQGFTLSEVQSLPVGKNVVPH